LLVFSAFASNDYLDGFSWTNTNNNDQQVWNNGMGMMMGRRKDMMGRRMGMMGNRRNHYTENTS